MRREQEFEPRPGDQPAPSNSNSNVVVPDADLFTPRAHDRKSMPAAVKAFADYIGAKFPEYAILAAGLTGAAEQLRRTVFGTFEPASADCEAVSRRARALIDATLGSLASEVGLGLDSHIVLPTRIVVYPDARSEHLAAEIGQLTREVPTLTGIELGVAGIASGALLGELRQNSPGYSLNQYIHLVPGAYTKLTIEQATLLIEELRALISSSTRTLSMTEIDLSRPHLAPLIESVGTASVSTLALERCSRPTWALDALAMSTLACETIEDLTLTTRPGSTRERSLFCVDSLPSLERLRVDSETMAAEDLLRLLESKNTPRLHSLVYDSVSARGQAPRTVLEAVGRRSSITSLLLRGLPPGASAGYLFGSDSDVRPQILELPECELNQGDLSAIGKLTGIRRLGLAGCRLDPSTVAALANVAETLALQELDLRGAPVSADHIRAILRAAPELRAQVSSPYECENSVLTWEGSRQLEEEFGPRVSIY